LDKHAAATAQVAEQLMVKRRRRFKQTVSFKDRLSSFAMELREEASRLPSGPRKDDLLKRARRAETAAHLDEWARSPGLQPPI
jgi:hypothetical protein